MDTPQVSVSDISALLAAPHEEPVLYLTEQGGLDVWAAAYVWHYRRVLDRDEVIDFLGDDPDADAIRDRLPEFQADVDAAVERYTDCLP
ncbi:hypothetical protein [Streptomyces halstedii]|uniref:Uncharacterized protein n=1 Tax=Streptomyces halstedii TaxID=1944 RepID=A0A6N9UF50_STRHA|nr:hypothetical protein [Streptomyces halstedii]NEA20716.1 hypothetical protein [Streptomyces halstedii]